MGKFYVGLEWEREGLGILKLGKKNYLIVRNYTNPCWAFSCYGRKVEQVISYRKKGINIVIVNENDFWDAMV